MIRIMGVLNVTPDSFSDGGQFASLQAAIEQADRLVAAGADIVDVGGESTRPYAEPVSAGEEVARVIPVIEAIRRRHRLPISIDTSKGVVARAALAAGANMINDISALSQDPEMIAVVRESTVPVVIMHMQGTPADMQIRPNYRDVVTEVLDFFNKKIDWLTDQGIDRNRLIVDPGIGFGKSLQHNLSLLKHLDAFSRLGLPLLLGHSRKRFLGEITGQATAGERDLATAVVAALCASPRTVQIVRVHDVAGTRQALQLAAALAAAD